MPHTCHAIGCKLRCSPRHFMCTGHWALVPEHLRLELCAAYQAGQEVTKTPSRRWLLASTRIRRWMAAHEGNTRAVSWLEGIERALTPMEHQVFHSTWQDGLAARPELVADHAIIDPPYSARVHDRLGTERRKDGHERQELEFTCMTEADIMRLASGLYGRVKRWLIVFCDELLIGPYTSTLPGDGWEYVRTGYWVKSDAMPQMTGDRPAAGAEPFLIFHAMRMGGVRLSGMRWKPVKKRWNGGGKPAVYRGPAQVAGVARIHDCQKPEWLYRALIRDFTDPGELVLDTHAGSCNLGRACKGLGRRFVGFEAMADNHAAGAANLAAAAQMGLF